MTESELRDFQRNLPMALLRAREAVMGHFRPILRDHDITEQQWRVIRALFGHDGLEVTALAEKTLLLMPSLTRILKTLEEQKLVNKTAVEGDNRRKLIRLANRGRDLYKKMAPLSEAEYKKIEAQLGSKKLTELYKLLSSISD
jgi:homoprotocatechuate degradation regulator HpaR